MLKNRPRIIRLVNPDGSVRSITLTVSGIDVMNINDIIRAGTRTRAATFTLVYDSAG